MSEKSSRGRPSHISEALTPRLVQLVAAGNSLSAALATIGLPRSTAHDWIRRGDVAGSDPRDEPYREFRRRVERARCEGQALRVAAIASAASKDWRAAAWSLEREWPELWSLGARRASDGLNPLELPGDELARP